jgi:hypothetical protein
MSRGGCEAGSVLATCLVAPWGRERMLERISRLCPVRYNGAQSLASKGTHHEPTRRREKEAGAAVALRRYRYSRLSGNSAVQRRQRLVSSQYWRATLAVDSAYGHRRCASLHVFRRRAFRRSRRAESNSPVTVRQRRDGAIVPYYAGVKLPLAVTSSAGLIGSIMACFPEIS